MQRPGEIGLSAGVGKAATARDHVGVAEMLDGVEGNADTRTNERRDRPPGAEVDIGVHERDPLRLAGAVVVGIEGSRAGVEEAVERVKARLAAILSGYVRAEPAVPLIADARAEERRTVEPALVQKAELRRSGKRRMRDVVEKLIALANIAAQVPAT